MAGVYTFERRSHNASHSYFVINREGAVVGGLLVDTSIPFDGELASTVTAAFHLHEVSVSGASEVLP